MNRFIRLETPGDRDISMGATLMKFVTSQSGTQLPQSTTSPRERAELREHARKADWVRWLMTTDNNSQESQ